MVTATDSRPNFLVVVVDDMGYSNCEPFGGEISTPRLQALAEAGARFRGFHTNSLCAPTRAMLLSGCDNHQAGMGVMQPMHAMNQYMQPGYEGWRRPATGPRAGRPCARARRLHRVGRHAADLGIDRFFEFRLGED